MTIAIGILASDGIVIAADREEGDGYLKNDQGKITMAFSNRGKIGAIGVTGAGDGPYLDEVFIRLQDALCHDLEKTPETVGSSLETINREYYTERVLPFAGYPDSSRPDYQLLVGCYGDSIKKLWSTSRLAFTEVRDYEAIGAGATVAKMWLNRLYDYVALECAAKLAAFVIFQVKSSVGSCGLGTDILVLPRLAVGLPNYVPHEMIRKWEHIFRAYPKLERTTFYYSVGSDFEKFVRTEVSKESLTTEADRLRTAFMSVNGQNSKGQQ